MSVVGPVTAEYGREGETDWRRVAVDPAAGTVTFHRGHHPRRFLAWGPDPEYACPLSAVRGLCRGRQPGVGPVLEVVTPAGRAGLPESAAGFDAVRAALAAGLAPGARVRWYQYQAVRAALLLAVIVPGGLLGAGLVDAAGRLAPGWAVTAALVGTMSLVLVVPAVSRLRGKSLW